MRHAVQTTFDFGQAQRFTLAVPEVDPRRQCVEQAAELFPVGILYRKFPPKDLVGIDSAVIGLAKAILELPVPRGWKLTVPGMTQALNQQHLNDLTLEVLRDLPPNESYTSLFRLASALDATSSAFSAGRKLGNLVASSKPPDEDRSDLKQSILEHTGLLSQSMFSLNSLRAYLGLCHDDRDAGTSSHGLSFLETCFRKCLESKHSFTLKEASSALERLSKIASNFSYGSSHRDRLFSSNALMAAMMIDVNLGYQIKMVPESYKKILKPLVERGFLDRESIAAIENLALKIAENTELKESFSKEFALSSAIRDACQRSSDASEFRKSLNSLCHITFGGSHTES